MLRGAGFPANLVTGLAQPLCASAADALVLAENAVEDQFQAAIRSLNEILDRFTSEGMQRDDDRFKTVLSARRRLADRKAPENHGLSDEFTEKFQAIKLAITERDRAQAQFESSFSGGIESQCKALRAFACDTRFQEAVVWQNRQAFETAIRPVASQPANPQRNQRQRNHEELVANYVQRYCVKNDTIGFFGPVAWARIESDGPVLELVPGPSLVKQRHTYFENWTIDKVATSLSLMEGIDWWIPPRLVPDVFIGKGVFHRAGEAPTPLTELEQAVLPLCDGKHLPEEILGTIRCDPRLGAIGRQELSDVLRTKAAEGSIVWRFLVPVQVNSEISLREQLFRIGDAELRATAISRLERLEAARNEVTAAADPVQLSGALRNVELVFEEITRAPGNRNAGATYGARTVLYEDCQRDLTLRITPDLLSPIVPALSLLLESLRWYMQSTALEFYRLFRQTYGELAATRLEVPLLDWWIYTEPKLLHAPSLHELDKVFRQKWAEVLPVGPLQGNVQFETRNLQKKVEQLFPDLGAGYCPVRYFCPDLMLAAENADAVRRGELLYVLGELHSAKNSLVHAALVEQHPNRQDLVDATAWDLSNECFKILDTQEAGTTTVRTSEGFLRPGDYLLATTPDAVAPRGFECHPFSELILREQEGELHAVSRSTGRQFHILQAFSDLLFSFVVNKASWIPPSRHVPRVSIDKLVIHRETWRFRRDELAFALEKDEEQRFLGARRWMKQQGIPRRTFVKSASEMKPYYLDLESPVLVEILCRTVRRMNSGGTAGVGEELRFSEMLPGIEQLWLRDAAGAGYTSELRFAVVDLKARSRSNIQGRRQN